MLKIEDVTKLVEKLEFEKFIRMWITKNNNKYTLQFDSEKVANKLILNFANRHAFSLKQLSDFIDNNKEDIEWTLNEFMFSIIDDIIKNADNPNRRYWKLETEVVVTMLQFVVDWNLRDMYLLEVKNGRTNIQ